MTDGEVKYLHTTIMVILIPIGWDGTLDGKPVVEGVYFYELDFNDGTTPPKTGFIQLIR